VNSPTTINFGNVRSGTTQNQAVSVTNIANVGAPGLDASLSPSGAATGTGTITQLAPGATDDTSLSVGLIGRVCGLCPQLWVYCCIAVSEVVGQVRTIPACGGHASFGAEARQR
jgi:hypothetical protein